MKKSSGSLYDLFQIFNRIKVEPDDIAKPREKRCSEQACAGRCADEREGLKRELEGGRVRTVARHDVDFEGLYRRVEAFFDCRRKPMDLVDQEHIVGFELGEKTRERAFVFDGGSACCVERYTHF